MEGGREEEEEERCREMVVAFALSAGRVAAGRPSRKLDRQTLYFDTIIWNTGISVFIQ